MSSRTSGIIEVILSGMCFGFLGIFGKAAYKLGLKPGEFLSLRFSFAFLILFTFLFIFKRKLLRISFPAILKPLALGIFGYAIFTSCYFNALKGLSASLTVLLLYMYPVIVSLGAWIVFKEKISALGWIALPITFCGMCFLVWGDMQVHETKALFFGVASAFVYSAYILASRKWLHHISPLTSAMYIQLATAVTLTLIHFESWSRTLEVIRIAWPLILAIAFFSTVLAMLLLLSGLKKLTSLETGILSTTEPVTAIVAASIILGERLSLPQTIGAILVLTSLILTSWKRKSKLARK